VQPQANLVGVKIPAYSSLSAFLAHYRALKSDASRSADDDQLLSEMSAVIATLSPEARAALDSTEDSASARRHRDRAELQLRRELVARGIVVG
jgi:alkylhydroperoxidase family enzyme